MSDAYNHQTALSRLDDDLELLSELAVVYLEEELELIASVGQAVSDRDAEAISRAAHKLKGAASNFCADPTTNLAMELETLGRSGELATAPGIWERLEAEAKKLSEALQKLAT